MTPTVQLLILIGSLGSMMWAMLKFMLKDIHKDLKDIHEDIADIHEDIADIKHHLERAESRTDHLYEVFLENQKKTDLRMDHLYQVCIDILNSRR